MESSIALLLLTLYTLIYLSSADCAPGDDGDDVQNKTIIYLKNFHDFYYTGEINLGSPGQKLRVMFDTGAGLLWVSSVKLCELYPKYCNNHRPYDPRLSNTSVEDGHFYSYTIHSYLQRFISGYIAQDVLQLGDLTINDQLFASITDMDESSRRAQYEGILGLGLVPAGGEEYAYILSPIVNIIEGGLLERSEFSFYLSKYNSSVSSQLVLGGVDETKFKGQFVTTSVISRKQWVIVVDMITIGNTVVTDSIPTVVRSGAVGISGPFDVIEDILEAMGATLEEDGLHYVDCSKLDELPILTLFVDDKPLQLSPKYYVVQFDDVNRGKTCWSGFSPADVNVMILGATFMRYYYTVFDLDNRKISFACAV